MLHDIRYALRTMAANPLFAAMAVLSLALGIGANTAIYSFMDAILMRALPVADPGSLVVLQWHSKAHPGVARSFSGSIYRDPHTGTTSPNFPYAVFETLRADHPLFSSVFAYSNAGRLNVLVQGQADLAQGEYVSGEFFGGLGVPPAAGRLISLTDDREGAEPILVASYSYAQRHFGDASHAVGQRVLINDNAFTVVGVAAPEFFGINPAGAQDLFLPMHMNLLLDSLMFGDQHPKYTDRNTYWTEMMARLRPGVSIAQAQAALVPVFHNFVESTARTDKERSDLPVLHLSEGGGGLDSLRRQYSKPLYVLMGMVGLILAIACANIANLLLARATARRREMAVRLSLGAGRARVLRQLLTESVLLAVMGGAAGLAFAAWGIRALTLLIANGRENFTLHANLNWHVLAITLGLAVVTGMLFGLAPALQSTRVDLTSALKQTRAGEHRFRVRPWLRVSLSQSLVVSQIAITLLLLVAAGLFVRTLGNLNSVALGFNRENVLLFTVNAKQPGYRDQALVRFYDQLQQRLAGLPGVRAVSATSYALISGSLNNTNFTIPGYTGPNKAVNNLAVAPGFFSTMQTPILLGREIEERDVTSTHRVAVVNEAFVKTYYNGENPVGRYFGLGGKGAQATPDIEIVGVAKASRYHILKEEIDPVVYFPYSQNLRALGQLVFEVRAAGDPMALANSVRQAVQQADARVPVSNVVTQAKQIDQTIAQERTFATLCTCFAVLAVLIACVGLYGTMAYSVARRTNELGLRMALGAERRRLIWMVLREVLLLAGAGLAIGLPAALASTRLVESFLFGLKPNDAAALTAAALLVVVAAVAAGFGPARRASRIDPWTALRHE
jgi:predicted permease